MINQIAKESRELMSAGCTLVRTHYDKQTEKKYMLWGFDNLYIVSVITPGEIKRRRITTREEYIQLAQEMEAKAFYTLAPEMIRLVL